MKITRRQLNRIIKESLVTEQVMWHSTAPENVEAILSQGLQTGRESANTIGGAWADEFYGTRPIYLSVQKGKYEGQPLAVNVSGLGLVADLPTLVDTGAYQEEEGMYWDEGSEPAQMMDIVDEDGMVYFDELLSPGSAAAQAAIDLTGTAAVVQDIPSQSISTEEGGLKSDEPSAAESEWASKSQAEKDDHVKNAVWETMAWKRYRKHAQAEGIPFDPDNEADMKIARSWWSKQPESRQFEGKMKITKSQLRKLIKEEKAKLVREFKANKLEIEYYLKDIADSGRKDGLSPGSIKMMLQDEFMDNFGHHTDIMKYEKIIDDISKGLMETALNERGTGNPALQGKERAIIRAVVEFVDEYRLVMGLDPNDFGDDRRVRQAVQDVIAGVLGEDM